MLKKGERMVMKDSGGGGGGEIVQVHGGHIIRSTGRRDRHSKVFTSKGPRDRRVRLSAHTAIQFYDVQDRLGYDRPSKAVDWLINKAKNAIDKLDELPPWNPNNNNTMAALGDQPGPSSACAFQIQTQMGEEEEDSPFMPSTMDTQSIADTMKSFFPMSSGTSSMNFQGYPEDIMTRNRVVQTEDLCLSLHSSQGPSSSHHTPPTDQTTLFPWSAPVAFEPSYQRLVSWNGENREGYIFGSGSMPPPPQPFLTQSPVLSQRGTLQSSFSPSIADDWNEHQIHSAANHTAQAISGGQFASQGLLQFQVSMQIHGDQQQHRGVSNKPSSASVNSHQ